MIAVPFNVGMTNFTQTMLALRAEQAAFTVRLHNQSVDALNGLPRGYIPSTVVHQKVL